MEKRLYFIVGDLFANVLVATAATALSSWLIGGAPGMVVGMLLGMVLGMVIALPLGMGLLVPVLGIMEIISPCMISGMFGGMWGGMWALDGGEILRWGSATGVAVMALIYALNAFVAGPQPVEH